MNATCSPEVQSQIDRHLDAVERHLQAAGAERSKRRGIVDDLETQILEMLSAGDLGSIGPVDLEKVLVQLDPPEAYARPASPQIRAAERVEAEARPQCTSCRELDQAARWITLGFLGLAGLWFEIALGSQLQNGQILKLHVIPPLGFILLFVIGAVIASAATVAGPIVGRRSRGSP
jgi:hypothetical protein